MWRWSGFPWALIAAASVMQLGWLIVAVVIRNLSELPRLTDLIIDDWKLWVWTGLLRPTTNPPSAVWLVIGLTVSCCGYLAAIVAAQRWPTRGVRQSTVGGAAVFAAT